MRNLIRRIRGRWLVIKGCLDGTVDKAWLMYKRRIEDLEDEVAKRDLAIAEQNARHDYDMLMLDNSAAQVHEFAADNVAKAEEIVRLHSELAEARRERDEVRKDMAIVDKTCDRLQADRDTAFKSAATFHADNGKLRDRLAAIAYAANQPI